MPPYPMTEDQLIDGLGTQVGRYVDGTPDPDVLIRATGTLTASTLATVLRAAALLPDDIENFLSDFCTTLRQLTYTIIYDEDNHTDNPL